MECSLCDEAKAVLERVRRSTTFELEVIDIDSDPALRALYGSEVPIIRVDGRKAFKYHVSESALEKRIATAMRQAKA